MKIVHRKRTLHQKILLHFTDNGAKIALVKRNSNRNLVLEGCRPCPLFLKKREEDLGDTVLYDSTLVKGIEFEVTAEQQQEMLLGVRPNG